MAETGQKKFNLPANKIILILAGVIVLIVLYVALKPAPSAEPVKDRIATEIQLAKEALEIKQLVTDNNLKIGRIGSLLSVIGISIVLLLLLLIIKIIRLKHKLIKLGVIKKGNKEE